MDGRIDGFIMVGGLDVNVYNSYFTKERPFNN